MIERVVILGSGVCGLAAALRVHELSPSAEIVLVESEDRIGGLARSLTVGGLVADMGPHRIHTVLPDVARFLDGIAGEDMVTVERRSRMWLRGRWIEYPPKMLEILRVLGPGAVAGAGLSWAAGSLRDAMASGERPDTFEGVMTRAFGEELYRLIVLDYTRKVWKISPRRIHGDAARVRVSAGGLDKLAKRVLLGDKEGEETALPRFRYIPGGVENLVRKMAERLPAGKARVMTGTTVTGLRREGSGWKVETSDGASLPADFVISTIPVTDLTAMLQRTQPGEDAVAASAALRYIANFLVCIVANRPSVTDCQWLYFPGRDTVFNRGYEPGNFSRTMGDGQRSMIVLEITCHQGDRFWRASDARLVEATARGLERTGVLGRGDILETLVHRIPNTYPLYDLDYRANVRRVVRYLETMPGLLSTGRQGLFLHNNMDHSIHMGFRAAEAAFESGVDGAARAFYRQVRRFQEFRIVD